MAGPRRRGGIAPPRWVAAARHAPTLARGLVAAGLACAGACSLAAGVVQDARPDRTAVVHGTAAWPDRRCALADRHFLGINALAANPPRNYSFLHGGFSYESRQCALGGTLTIQLQHSQPLPAGAVLLKYGKPRGADAEQWYEYPAIISGDMVTYVVADGGAGDDDMAADGRVLAPVAIALSVQGSAPDLPWALGISVLAVLCGWAALARSREPGAGR